MPPNPNRSGQESFEIPFGSQIGSERGVTEAFEALPSGTTWDRGHSLASVLWLVSRSSSLRAFLTVLWLHCSDGSSSSRAKLDTREKKKKNSASTR